MVKKTILILILFLSLVIFSLGQLPSLLLTFIDNRLHVMQILDLLVFSYVLVSFIFDKSMRSKVVKSHVFKLILFLIVEFMLARLLLGFSELTSLMYLLRLASYLLFGFLMFTKRPLNKSEFVSFLVGSSLFISLTGLLQFLFLPDTRALYALGWDDHYFRLIGVFLDPAFTGIILVILLLSILFFWKPKKMIPKLGLLVLLAISMILTYSRASYLAFFGGVFIYLLRVNINKGFIKLFTAFIIFLGILFMLPRPSSEGVKLERTFSVLLRLKNYSQTIQIWKTSPFIGIGYNNICEAKELNLKNGNNLISHSCSGADNSFLLLLTTTGIVGILFFLKEVLILRKYLTETDYVIIGAISIHSFFSNTLFYPFIMFFIAILLSFKVKKKMKH